MNFMCKLIVAAVCVNLVAAQMTFTDQWAKKSLHKSAEPSYDTLMRQAEAKKLLQQPDCNNDLTSEALLQLERIYEAQKKVLGYLSVCYPQQVRQQ